MPCSELVVGTEGIELLVNGQKGQVKVANNSDLAIKVIAAPLNDIEIYVNNIFPIPDTLIAKGTTDAYGIFETNATIGENVIWDITAYEKHVLGDKASNTLRVIAGEGAGTDWGSVALIGIVVLGIAYVLGRRD